MFTPPSSPAPFRAEQSTSMSEAQSVASPDTSTFSSTAQQSSSSGCTTSPLAAKFEGHVRSTTEAKKRTARRYRWSILIVPAILILITASTRLISHPTAFDALSGTVESESWEAWLSTATTWQPHKRHPNPDPDPADASGSTLSVAFPSPTASSSSGAAAPSSSLAAPGSQALPTIPSTPPPLPTPFPQPFDSTLTSNFSTVGCQTFFLNMTQSEAFRECRPFSLLQSSSSAFIESQNNLTALNAILWGTCNTDPSINECMANLDWFSSNMRTTCSTDIDAQNAMVLRALTGLDTYALLRNAACLPDPKTNSYCYVEAVHSTNPSDLYFYQLPLGIMLSKTAKPSCSACTQSVMQLFGQATNLTSLQSTYQPAVELADQACGENYIQNTSGALRIPARTSAAVAAMTLVVLLAWIGI